MQQTGFGKEGGGGNPLFESKKHDKGKSKRVAAFFKYYNVKVEIVLASRTHTNTRILVITRELVYSPDSKTAGISHTVQLK